MSTLRNTDAIANAAPGGGSGEIKPRVDRDDPMMTGGHQPGKLVGNDKIPEFQAEVLPAGSAPAKSTFQPNPQEEAPPLANHENNPNLDARPTDAEDSLPGATSADVHTGLGHPGAGQSSKELRHDGQAGRKNPGQGLQGVGAEQVREFKTVDESDPKFKDHRGIDKEDRVLGRGEILSAEERQAESAETVAHEHGSKSRMDRGK